MIQRYDLSVEGGDGLLTGPWLNSEQSVTGKWVKYSDVKPLLLELERYRNMIKQGAGWVLQEANKYEHLSPYQPL